MVASSLLQPRYLQEVLEALLAGQHEAIYSIGVWLIGVALVGLVADGVNVTLAAYIAQGVSSDLREEFRLFLMPISSNSMPATLSSE